jgi:hypothetical protein
VSSSWPIPCHLRVRMFRWQSSCRQREQRGAKGACLASQPLHLRFPDNSPRRSPDPEGVRLALHPYMVTNKLVTNSPTKVSARRSGGWGAMYDQRTRRTGVQSDEYPQILRGNVGHGRQNKHTTSTEDAPCGTN